MFLLLLRQTLQPVITLARCSGTVFPCAVENAEDGQTEDGDLSAEVDGVAGVVLGSIFGDVSPAICLLG